VGSLAAREKKLSVFQQGILMGRKLSTTMIVGGTLLILAGLTFLAASISQKQDESVSGLGICAFALGALLCSTGIYLKARTVQAETPDSINTKPQPKQRGGCDLCGTEVPAVMCRVHQLQLCPNCLARHYDTRSCIFSPSTRRSPTAKAARA
jgi:hypothetical protein